MSGKEYYKEFSSARDMADEIKSEARDLLSVLEGMGKFEGMMLVAANMDNIELTWQTYCVVDHGDSPGILYHVIVKSLNEDKYDLEAIEQYCVDLNLDVNDYDDWSIQVNFH